MCGFEITVGGILCSCSLKSLAFTDYLVARVVIVLLNSTVIFFPHGVVLYISV